MLELIQAIPFSFAALFPVLNPIGSSIIFLSILEGASKGEINKLAMKVAINTAVMLTIVLIAGSWILRIFGITIPIVLIGGGLVLAHIGWQILNQPASLSGNSKAVTVDEKTVSNMAFFPLTMPITAGPGVIAVTITVGAHSFIHPGLESIALSEVGNVIGVLLVSLSVFLCYRYSQNIMRKLGETGAQVIIRLAAFVNLCIGLEIMWHGFKYLGIK